MQKDIVLIAHDAQVEVGDRSNRFITRKPDISGSAYKFLMRDFDMIGLLTTSKESRLVDFTPSTLHEAKTFVPDVPTLAIPHFETPEYNTTLAQLITTAKDRINAKSEVAKIVEN